MENYLHSNARYYDQGQGYEAPNVESYVFRAHGRIFEHDFGLTGANGERVLDFGCGSGAALAFFDSKGFDVYGVDISEKDLTRARDRMPHIPDHFRQVDAKPEASADLFGGKFDLVISIQTLYFLSDTDFSLALASIYNNMKSGGYIHASMIGEKAALFDFSEPAEDGLRNVTWSNDRIAYKDLYMNFTKSKEDLETRFSQFEKIYIGHYDRDYRNEGSEFHYTFTGRKA